MPKDACIFCITRSQFAALRPFPRLQQRSFGASGVNQKASARALAESTNNGDAREEWKGTATATQQQSGGWSSNVTPRGLTAQEQALRDALRVDKSGTKPMNGSVGQYSERRGIAPQKSDQASQSIPGSPLYSWRPLGYEDAGPGSLADNHIVRPSTRGDVTFRNDRRSGFPPGKAHKEWAGFDEGQNSGPSFGGSNRQDSRLQGSTTHENKQDDLPHNRSPQWSEGLAGVRVDHENVNKQFPVQDWKHVRRRGFRPNGDARDDHEFSGPPVQRHPSARHDNQTVEEARMKRMERTKSGDYVGFRGASGDSTSTSYPAQAATDDQSSQADVESAEVDRLKRIQPRSKGIGSGVELTSVPYRRSRSSSRKREEVWNADYDLEDLEEEPMKRRRQPSSRAKPAAKGPAAKTQLVRIPEYLNVGSLIQKLKVTGDQYREKITQLGYDSRQTSSDHILAAEEAALIAAEFDIEAVVEEETAKDLLPERPSQDLTTFPPRTPIIVIMGHVDHGKTTLLDRFRKSSIAAMEHGGITQRIGAFSVRMPSGGRVTIIDTPGHKTFDAMRKRGAESADIVVLVVAADDGIKPQTVEAIRHCRNAQATMIVAITKIDKEVLHANRIQDDLTSHDVFTEDRGGEVQLVEVSAKTGQGIDDLEAAIDACASTMELRAPVDGQVEGTIIEAEKTKAGNAASVLVSQGKLEKGNILVAGEKCGIRLYEHD